MNLSNTGGGGRGSDSGSIIGDVICHGKKKFWTAGGSYHYHHGMAAGENTLDTILCRLLVDSLVKVRKGGDADKGIVDVERLVDRGKFADCDPNGFYTKESFIMNNY